MAFHETEDGLLTTPQAAAVLGFHPDYLRALARRGKVRHFRTDLGQIRFLPHDIEAYKKQHGPGS